MNETHLLALLQSEWSSLRQESLEAVERRVSLVVWGTTAYAALGSAVAWLLTAGWQYEPYVFWLLSVALPMQALSLATLWTGEAMRSARAGAYLSAIEHDAALLMEMSVPAGSRVAGRWMQAKRTRPFPGLSWETALRTPIEGSRSLWPTMQLQLPYYAIAGYFLAMSLAPCLAAFEFGYLKWGQQHLAPAAVAVMSAFWFCFLFGSFFRKGIELAAN